MQSFFLFLVIRSVWVASLFSCHLFGFRGHVLVMTMNPQTSFAVSDEQLWRLACEGDRDAFSKIVERYQSLVCSLAYSACGALGTSEDMAQETFITAWHRLKDLREPGKLRQWLCGIVRNISANAARRDLRRGGEPEPLDAAAEELCDERDPAAQTITPRGRNSPVADTLRDARELPRTVDSVLSKNNLSARWR